MAILKSQGTAVLMSISAVYTAFTNVISTSIAGTKSLAMDTTVLSGSQFKTKAPNGLTETANLSIEKMFDPADTVDAAFIALEAAPVATNFKVTYTNSGPTSVVYSGVAFGHDANVSVGEPVKATLTIETSGAPA